MGNNKRQDEIIFFAKARRNFIYLEFQFLTQVMLNLSKVWGLGAAHFILGV